MNQEDRDEILKIIDLKKNVSNEDLFLYDLTPYYSLNNCESFFSKILIYQLQQEQMKHNNHIYFTPEQRRIFNEISNSGRYAISATTSFGKTTIIKEFIKVYKPRMVVYIVPTNALADELLESFRFLYESDGYDIIDTSISEQKPFDKEYLIFIGTQEKLSDIKWLKNNDIELFVIDEAYKLGDDLNGYREISLNRNFIDFINISKTFILLLPLVNNILGLSLYDIKLLKTDYSPVAKDYIGINHNKFDEAIINKISENQEKNLVYFQSPLTLETFFWDNQECFNDRVSDNDWLKRVSNDFHSEWFPIIAYKKGIAVHNGNMPKFIQTKMVKEFNGDNSINTIFSTSSLIEGVNTPTKNIFIKDHNIYSSKNRIKYKNLIGRAGRLNVTPVGRIYYDNNYQTEFEEANMNWKNIDLKLIIQNDEILEEINREDTSVNIKTIAEKYELDYDKLVDYLENSGLTYIHLQNLIDNLIKYDNYCKNNFFPKNTPALVFLYNKCHYCENHLFKYCIPNKSKDEVLNFLSNMDEYEKEKTFKSLPYRFFEALFSATLNSTINNKSMYNISSMLDYINSKIDKNLYNCNNSQIISTIVGMIYSFLPYDLIPLLENIISLNTLFTESGKNLLDEKIINYINEQIGKYNIKYFGKIETGDKEKKIIRRLFEYGIPYHIIKDDIDYLVNEVEDNFSIYHIKNAIERKKDLNEKLKGYFE